MMAGLSNDHRWRTRSDLPPREPRRSDPEHRGWLVVQTYEDQGISGAKGRDQRPAFDTMLKDAARRVFEVLMVWSFD